MDAHVKETVRDLTRRSDENAISFPEVLRHLAEVGVERYHADLVAATKTYYLPDGGHQTVPSHPTPLPARDFSPAAVAMAVRASQGGEIGYSEFCRRIAQAGCTGYVVTLAGRRAVYSGRTGDTYVEWFPPL